MLSQAGRYHEIQTNPKPLGQIQRYRMYNSCQVKAKLKTPRRKDPSFDSVGRQKQDSFFYRHSKDITLNANYSPKYQYVHPLSPRPSLDKAKLIRKIGDIRDQDYSKPLDPQADQRCHIANYSSEKPKLVNQSDIQNYRKKHDNIDFSKQLPSLYPSSQSLGLKKKYSTQDTIDDTLPDLSKTVEVKRINRRVHKNLANIHPFQSYSGHQYLKEVYDRPVLPDYDIQKANQSILKRSMAKPKVYINFGKYRDQISSRYDRLDPEWHTLIDKRHDKIESSRTIDFSYHEGRKPNEVYSKYPIRLSLGRVQNKTIDI